MHKVAEGMWRVNWTESHLDLELLRLAATHFYLSLSSQATQGLGVLGDFRTGL